MILDSTLVCRGVRSKAPPSPRPEESRTPRAAPAREMSSTATKPKASQHHVPLLSLSSEYLAGCTLVGDVSAPSVADPAAAEPREAPPAAADGEDGNFHCGVSRATFDSAEALREHYHTDWYRFNLKRAQRQLAPVRPQHRHTAPSAQAKPPLEHEKA